MSVIIGIRLQLLVQTHRSHWLTFKWISAYVSLTKIYIRLHAFPSKADHQQNRIHRQTRSVIIRSVRVSEIWSLYTPARGAPRGCRQVHVASYSEWRKWTCRHCICSETAYVRHKRGSGMKFHVFLLLWPWPWLDDPHMPHWPEDSEDTCIIKMNFLGQQHYRHAAFTSNKMCSKLKILYRVYNTPPIYLAM